MTQSERANIFTNSKKRKRLSVVDTTEEEDTENGTESDIKKDDIQLEGRISTNEQDQLAQKYVSRNTSPPAERRKESNISNMEHKNWENSKKLLHSAQVQEVLLWNQPHFTENSLVDDFGFTITHRNCHYIAWKSLYVGFDGFVNVRRETNNDYKNFGYIPHDYELWWKGDIEVIGSDDVYSVRVFDDSDRPFSRLNPNFKLKGVLETYAPELKIPRTYPKLLPLSSEMDEIELPRIQVIVRSLVLSPPHRCFHASFSLNHYKYVRQYLLAGLLHRNPRKCRQLQLESTSGTNEPSSFSNSPLIKEIISNHFHAYRERIDSSGFVVFHNIFKSLKDEVESKWPGMEQLVENDNLSKQLSEFLEY